MGKFIGERAVERIAITMPPLFMGASPVRAHACLRKLCNLTGEFLRQNTGHWLLEATARGTRATYTIDLRLGAGIPSTVETALAQQGLPRLLASFKARAEALPR